MPPRGGAVVHFEHHWFMRRTEYSSRKLEPLTKSRIEYNTEQLSIAPSCSFLTVKFLAWEANILSQLL